MFVLQMNGLVTDNTYNYVQEGENSRTCKFNCIVNHKNNSNEKGILGTHIREMVVLLIAFVKMK